MVEGIVKMVIYLIKLKLLKKFQLVNQNDILVETIEPSLGLTENNIKNII